MTINNTLLQTAISTATEIFSAQTANDLQIIKDHLGSAYDESKIVAEIAVKLILRIGNVAFFTDGRALSPVDALVFDAEQTYRERYGA